VESNAIPLFLLFTSHFKALANYPLASYLHTVIRGVDLTKLTGQDVLTMASVNDRTAKAAQIFVGTIPILLVYPFLQKYFVKGIVLGSVKE